MMGLATICFLSLCAAGQALAGQLAVQSARFIVLGQDAGTARSEPYVLSDTPGSSLC